MHRPARRTTAGRRTGGTPASWPSSVIVTGPKSTSASAPGSFACGTNPSRLPARPFRSASISGRRRATYFATYEYDTSASCSSRSRTQARLAVCRCLRGASRSSVQHRVDQRRHRVPRGRRPLRHLPRGRHRRRQRLPHRPPVHPVLPGDRPDPHPLPVILPDHREQSHPVPSHPPSVSGKQHECDHYPRSRTTCPATSPACRRKPAPRRGQIRGELTAPPAPRWSRIKGEGGAISE